MVRKPPCDEFGQRTKPAIGYVLFPLRVIVGFIVSASGNPWSLANHSTRYYTLSISADILLLNLIHRALLETLEKGAPAYHAASEGHT